MVQERIGRNPLPPANELSANDWENLDYQMLTVNGQKGGKSTFGGRSDEIYINNLTPDHPSFRIELDTAAEHMSKCIVVIPERCEDSNKVIRHYFPWLNTVDLCKTRLNTSRVQGANKTSLAENATEIILKYNQMDELLFRFGESLFEKQLKLAISAVEAPVASFNQSA
jgi:hypothetical protein